MVHRSSGHRGSADLLVSGDAGLRCCCCCWWSQWPQRWWWRCRFVNHASETDAKPEKPDKTGQSTHRENGIFCIHWELCNASSAAEVMFNSEISAIRSPIALGILCSDWAVYGQEFYDRPPVWKSLWLQGGSGIAKEEEVRKVLEVEEGVSASAQCQHQQRNGQDVEDDASDHLRTHVYTSRKFILWINIAL